MPENSLIVAVISSLGVGGVIGVLVKHYLGKAKHDAEIQAIHSSTTSQQLQDLKDAIALVTELRKQMEADRDVIAALKGEKIEDDRKIARRDGVIEEQRREIKELHDEVGQLRAKCSELEIRVSAMESLERENKELLKENYQLKGGQENAASEDTSGRE
jgi:NAD dependent epimerase/dehydratase family enzyme